MNLRLLPGALGLTAALSLSAADFTLHTFKRLQLSDQFWCEGASFRPRLPARKAFPRRAGSATAGRIDSPRLSRQSERPR